MNKPQLQERARNLGIPVDDSDTSKVLQAKIAEVESALKEDKEPLEDNDEQGRGADTVATVEDSLGDEVEVYSDGSTQKAEFEGEVKADENSDESEEVTVKDEEAPQPVASIITTSTISAPEREKQEQRADVEPKAEPKTVQEKKDEQPEGSEVFRYVGNSGTYQTSKYVFSKSEPFLVVDKDDVEKAEDNPRLRKATKSEVEEFYSE